MRRTMLILAAVTATVLPALAQQKMNMPGMNMPAANKSMPGMDMDEVKSNAPYHPGLGELMTAFVQPRHIKLGLAGQAQNWDYAAYELAELKETFEDVGKMILKHGNLQIAPAIASTVTPAMDALDKATKAKDAAAFAKAYDDLTDACNACHKSADHPMVVIQVPSAAAFPDQNFSPPK